MAIEKMKMKKQNILTLAACLFLLICLAQASALSEDFSASSGKIVYVGECSTALSRIFVINTGDITSSYTVSLEGSAAKWVSYAPSRFTLRPGERENIQVHLKVPCNAKGSYNLDTYITTKLGIKKVIKQEVVVSDVQNMQIEPAVYSSTINPCETAVFKFNIINTGDFPETYNFEAPEFPGKISFNHNSLTIGGSQSSQLEMYVTPNCDVWGIYDLAFVTSAKLSGATAETAGIMMSINRNYDFSVVFGDLYIPQANVTPTVEEHVGAYYLCEQDYGAIPVLVENTGSVANTYYFEIEGRKWTTLSQDTVELNPGETDYININVNPPELTEDDFEIKLKVISNLGEIEKVETKSVVVDVCYFPLIAKGTDKIKTYYEESFANLTLANSGSKNAVYKLEVSGADWISVAPLTLAIAPESESMFSLYMRPTADTPEGKYYLAIKASVEGEGVQYIREITVVLKDPRFSNMIFDEYLPYTIFFVVLLIIFAIIMIFVFIHLENTKEERAVRREQRRKENERRRIEKERENELRRKEKEKLMLERQKEKERRKLERQKEKERRKLEREKELEKRAEKREKLMIAILKEKELRRLEKEKKKALKKQERERKNLEKQRKKEQKRLKKEKAQEKKREAREKKRLEKEQEKAKKIEAKIAAEKETKAEKPKKPKKKLNLKWLYWVLLGIVILVCALFVCWVIYRIIRVIILFYYTYLLIGIIAAAALAVIFITGEIIISKLHKYQAWERIPRGKKAVVELSWKKGLGELVIRLKKPVENAGILIKRKLRKPTYLAAGEKVYQYFEVRKNNIEDSDIEKASFRFRVKKSWLRKRNIPESSVKLVRYNNDRWVGIGTDIVMSNKKYVFYRADSQSCSFFAITGKPRPPKPKPVEKKPEKKIEKKVVEKKIVEKKVKPKPKKKKPKKKKSDVLKLLKIIVLIAVVLGIVGFGIFFVVKNIDLDFISEENITELPEEDLVEEEIEEEAEEEIEEEPIEEEEELPAEEELEEIVEVSEEKGPGLWQRFVGWVKGLFERVSTPVNVTEDNVTEEIEEPLEEELVEEIEEEVTEEEVEEEIEEEPIEEEEAEEEVPENVTEEVEEEEELAGEPEEKGPSLWQRFVGWLGGFIEKIEEVPENVTEEVEEEVEDEVEEVVEEPVEEVEEEPVEAEEDVDNETAVVEEEEPTEEIEEEVTEDVEEEELPAEEVEEEEMTEVVEEPEEEGPSLWQRFVGWVKGLFERISAPLNVTEENVTEEAEEIVEEEVPENVTEEVEEEEPVETEENVTVEEEEEIAEEVEEEPEEDEEGIPRQEWDEDTQHTLDLSQYFYDPDGDVLSYTYTPLEYIRIYIDEKGIATFTPKRNWHGEERVVFTADDGKGGVISSNEIRLIVKDQPEPPFAENLKESLSMYSNYVLIGVLILIILILLIEFRKPIMKFLEED